jgi:hypothetical protein
LKRFERGGIQGSTVPAGNRQPSLLTSIITLLVLFLGVLVAFWFGRSQANRGLRSAFEDTVKRSRLVSDMQVKLLASAEAEKSAVMADTDQASAAFADEARRDSAAVEADRLELGALIEAGDRSEEIGRFNDFNECWKRYQDVDREVLDLAVQNTNLKAQKLSFGPASEAIDRMRTALDTLVDGSAAAAATAATKGAYRAMVAALEIQVLESRHIAEARDEEMDRIEAQMKRLDGQVREGLAGLAAAVGATGAAAVATAQAAYADFEKVNAELVRLSRQNSNVRSLAISLGQKRKVTVQCQELLEALRESVRNEGSRATR